MADAHYAIRFVGRFVFAQPKTAQGAELPFVDALALNMEFNPDVKGAPHQFMMSASGEHVEPGKDRRPHDMIVAASTGDERDIEQFIWNLRGMDVSFEVQQGSPFTWSDRVKLGRLDILLDILNQASTLQKPLLTAPDKTGLVVGSVHVDVGSGTAERLIDGRVNFVTIETPDVPADLSKLPGSVPRDDNEDGTPEEFPLADLVTVNLTLPQDAKLTIHLTPRGDGTPGKVVLTENGRPTVVTFSNLCTQLNTQVDEEYAGLYEVFQAKPKARARLVPKRATQLGGGTEDCYSAGSVDYEVG